jgi:hypothetical protein
MSCYLDKTDIIDCVERGNMRYIKSILGLKNQVSSERLRLILNKPLEKHTLWVLLRKTLKKYKQHFGEDAWIFNKANYKYEKWIQGMSEGKDDKLVKAITLEKKNYTLFKRFIGEHSLKEMASNDGIIIGDKFREMFKKNYFVAWDKRDNHLIRYLVNHGFWKGRFFPKCRHCGELNSRKHVTNECKLFDDLRNIILNELKKTRRGIVQDLEKAILDVYFNPGENFQKELEILKRFAIQLVITSCQEDGGCRA